jgi:hypothetical protein
MKKTLSFLLACLSFIYTAMSFFVSCSNTKSAERIFSSDISYYKRSNVLLPNDMSVSGILPYYNYTTDELTIIAYTQNEIYEYHEETEENIFIRYTYRYFAVTLDRNMNIVLQKELKDISSALSVSYMNPDSLYTVVISGTSVSVLKYSLTDGGLDSSVQLEYKPVDILCSLVVDSEGYIYIADTEGIHIFSEEGKMVSEISLPYDRTVLTLSPNGSLYIGAEFDGNCGMAQLSHAKSAYGNITYYDNSVYGIFFRDEENMYVYTSDGLYLTNNTSITKLMDSAAEGISTTDTGIIGVADNDRFFTLTLNTSNDIPGYILTVHDKTSDNEIKAVNTVDVAVLTEFDTGVMTKYAYKFNSSCNDIHVKITDYSQYDDGSIMDGEANKRLGIDMISGVYQPDIIVTSPKQTSLNNYIVNNGLFTDYYELFARDDSIIQEEDIFQCVKNAFTDKNGKMWAMTDSFIIYTQLINKKYLLGKNTWTVDDMIDVYEALPEGVVLNDYYTKSTFTQYFVETGAYYTQFVDLKNNFCDFENTTFYRYLNFIKSLPDEPIRFEGKYYESTNRYPSYVLLARDGRIAMSRAGGGISYIRSWKIYDIEFTDEYEFIGYPTTRNEHSYMNYKSAYIITSYCANISYAWNFVHYLLTYDLNNNSVSSDGLPTYMPLFRQKIEATMDFQEKIQNNPDEYTEFLPEIVMTYDDCSDLINFINTQVADSVYNLIPPEIIAIITEEISYYNNNIGSAEECAKKIQSRVSIWLSENE